MHLKVERINNKMWLGTELYNGCSGKLFSQNLLNKIISYASDIGIDKIDTAECYEVEKNLGIALKNLRSDFKIATKFGHQVENGLKVNKFDLKSVKKQLEASLRFLKTDYIDLYYFHSGDNHEFMNEEVWDFLNKAKDEGKIIELGLSLRHKCVLDRDDFQINLAKDYGISVVQTVLNINSQQSLYSVIPYCKKHDIKVIARLALGKGLLTGKYNENYKFHKTDSRSKTHELNRKIILNNKNRNVEDALNWCSKFADEIIVGSKNKTQMLENYNIINSKNS
jgi:myo-inositol catabolism protein IolS